MLLNTSFNRPGHPIGGAEVWLSSVPPSKKTSEGDGTFAFDKLVGREYTLAARAGELLGRLTGFKLTATSDPVVVRISAGAKVIVTVVSGDDKPIEGAEVKLAVEGEHTARTEEPHANPQPAHEQQAAGSWVQRVCVRSLIFHVIHLSSLRAIARVPVRADPAR